MSNVYVISDLHLGHKRILEFSGQWRNWADSVLEHDHILIERIRSVCKNKRDILYILGDVAMDVDKLEMLDEIPAQKILVRGNHDVYPDDVYRKYFTKILGFVRYKNMWLSHCPIHPDELRGKICVHGHVHSNSIRNKYTLELDNRYINACVENCEGYPINFAEIRDNTFKGVIK